VRVCSDPDGDVGQLADVLARDPILAGQVLRVANSAFYYRGSEVTSLHRAAMVIGMRALKVVALGFTLSSEMPQKGTAAGLDLPVYWHRSVLNAVIARSLARTVDQPVAEEAFLCGLLSDIGKLALTHAAPEQYGAVVAEAGGWPTEELERERLGFDASEAAERLLRGWKVPEMLVLGAAYATRSEQLAAESSDEARRIARIVGLAQCGTAVMFDEDKAAALVRFIGEAERRFGLKQDTVETLLSSIEEETGEAAQMLSVDLPSGVSYHGLVEQARTLMVQMSVEAMMRLDETSRTVAVLERENEDLQAKAHTDGLTGLPNREMLDGYLEQQTQLRLREELPGLLGVILIEVDRLGQFTEMLGHQAGDEVLRAVSGVLRQATRAADMLGRYGRERFCLVVPHGMPDTIQDAAERLRAAVEAHQIDLGDLGQWNATASLGCAYTKMSEPADLAKLMTAADVQLYQAKRGGGNRVVVAFDAAAAA
jgi:diguanylate cyclase (GGDEF)-like protein